MDLILDKKKVRKLGSQHLADQIAAFKAAGAPNFHGVTYKKADKKIDSIWRWLLEFMRVESDIPSKTKMTKKRSLILIYWKMLKMKIGKTLIQRLILEII